MESNTKVVRAIVDSNSDPDNLGRVQVKYPWLGDSSVVSGWARVCQQNASSNCGTWFPTQVGDEVLAMVEDNDLSSPIILGSLYSENATPPTSSLGNTAAVKYFQTSSGSAIVMDEENDTILLETGGGAKLKLKEDKVAFGSGGDELIDLNIQLLEAIINAAPTMVSTSVGPGVLNPEVMTKLNELKMKLTQIKGDL